MAGIEAVDIVAAADTAVAAGIVAVEPDSAVAVCHSHCSSSEWDGQWASADAHRSPR